MEIRLLGPFEVVVDGAPIELSARRPRAVLAALVLRAGKPVSVDTLTEAVWDGGAPASSGSVLRLYIAQVRRALPPGRLVTKAPGYQLDLEDGELDAARFELLFADGRQALEGGNVRLARTLFGVRSTCGAVRRSPTWRRARSRGTRRPGWMGSTSHASRPESTQIFVLAATSACWRISSGSSPNTRCASARGAS